MNWKLIYKIFILLYGNFDILMVVTVILQLVGLHTMFVFGNFLYLISDFFINNRNIVSTYLKTMYKNITFIVCFAMLLCNIRIFFSM